MIIYCFGKFVPIKNESKNALKKQKGDLTMKRTVAVLIIIAVALSLSATSCMRPRVDLEQKPGVAIGIKKARGTTSPERALNIVRKSKRTQTLILLEEKVQEAIKTGDPKRIKDAVSARDLVLGGGNGSGQGEYVFLDVMNSTSNYVIRMISAPFTGVELTPGKRTENPQAIPVGLYRVTYEECRIGDSHCRKKEVNIAVGEDRTTPINILNQ